MQRFSAFEIDELKLVYQILHKSLLQNMELMDAEFLQAMQSWLQYRAGQEGVDVSDHSQWDAWLNGQEPPTAPQGPEGRVIPLNLDGKLR